MYKVSTSDISKLREMTGAGMMDCKKALEESNGDYEGAQDWLRKKGIAKAAKREDREASEGVVIAHTNANKGHGGAADRADGSEAGGGEDYRIARRAAGCGQRCRWRAEHDR